MTAPSSSWNCHAESADYKVLFARTRYGGLRIPSELPRWENVNIGAARMTILSPKTERHAGHESRQVPIDKRLMPDPVGGVQRRARRRAAGLLDGLGGCVHVAAGTIIDRAGVERWPDLWQALRRSCELDWAQRLPQYVVSKWIGHSIAVSRKHYANLVTDQYFESVAGSGDSNNPVVRQTERSGVKLSGIDRNIEDAICVIPGNSTQFTPSKVEAGGIEPPSRDNLNNGLYMLRRCFNLEASTGHRHSANASSRLFLISRPTTESGDQPADFGSQRHGHSPQTEVA